MRHWSSEQDLGEKQSNSELEHFEMFERERDRVWSELKSGNIQLLNPEGIRTTITEGSSREHCCTANNSINTD